MLEDFINAFQNFARNKLRTVLSLLGVIIGVASVITITSLGSSVTAQITGTFGNAGLDMISVNSGFMQRRSRNGSVTFNDTFRTNLFDNVENIKKVWYKNSMSTTLSIDDLSSNTSCSAIETGYLEAYNFELEDGEFFNVTDNVEGTQKIILSHSTAESLFPNGGAVGSHIILVSGNITFAFTVTGVLKETNASIENGSAYVPRGFYSKKIRPNPTADTVMVQCVNEDITSSVTTKIKEYCTQISGSEYAVNVMSMQSMIEQINEITGLLSIFLACIAGISLLVGGIGIMNIMIVTVTERKQEIGIRKALGARPFDIKRQFLVESASITLIGGLIGIGFGGVLSLIIEKLQDYTLMININACIIAFVFSVFVGVFFGYNPAKRAAKLDPVLALAGE